MPLPALQLTATRLIKIIIKNNGRLIFLPILDTLLN